MAQTLNDRSNAGLWRHLRRDGTTLEVEVFTAVTEHEGRPARLSVAVDVTARRSPSARCRSRRSSCAARRRWRRSGRFAGGIAHDFNNLLTGILGYCDLALADLSPARRARGLRGDPRAGASAPPSLTAQILGFSRGRVVQAVPLDLTTCWPIWSRCWPA
jgi:signal transduction histidine kinase